MKNLIKRLLKEEINDNYLNFLNTIISSTSGKQKEFYQWIKDNATEVDMVEPESLFPQLNKSWAKKNLKIKDCYVNAVKVMDIDPNIKYVEGVILLFGQIPIDHAWNSYDGKYFDVTSHLWSPSQEVSPHYKFIELDKEKTWEILSKKGSYGDIINYLFRNNNLK